ncbi:triose-phosphate isomerase [Silvimonas iriomotensis]|uniref:Triosephosphate isomerase n=1 Tax=Silvimonas iriomotensis TaxID=449662 RepID=A0ABQ2PEN2_9NEIS|nr:triose-phosphate isomerase [Silvimonas iriomotensis]GGP23852.1 triosephosphate isomerase [Silvimonas iriomotensis]
MSLFARAEPALSAAPGTGRVPTRERMVVGNWKMHGSLALCREMVPAMASVAQPDAALVLCPPAPYLGEVARLAANTDVQCCAQNVADAHSGALTGEWSAGMLADLGCRYAIVGHSERRRHYHETDHLIAAKAQACLEAGITPIVCVGESWVHHQTGQTEVVLQHQLGTLLALPEWHRLIIAYEPVWAIGTGVAARPDTVEAAHRYIRSRFATRDPVVGNNMTVLYGGSVNADNATQLFALPDVDGALVGSASLQSDALMQIYTAALRPGAATATSGAAHGARGDQATE